MKPGTYLMKAPNYSLPVRIELWQGELYVIPPSGWRHLLCTFGPEYRFEPV